MFATDRDLLALEPNLFRDVSWLAQTLATATGTLTSGTLVLSTPALAGSGVAPGCVAVISRTPLEILAVSGDDTLAVSLTRPDIGGPQLIPADRTDAPVSIITFQPQLSLIHNQLLRMLGIGWNGSPEPCPSESSILNPRDLTLAESLGALHLIYAAAGAGLPDTSPQSQRAAMYKDRFAQERWRARARVDLNADGIADCERTLNISHLIRS